MHVYKAKPKQELANDKGRGGGKGEMACRYFARAASEAVGKGKRYFMEQVRDQDNATDLVALPCLPNIAFLLWRIVQSPRPPSSASLEPTGPGCVDLAWRCVARDVEMKFPARVGCQ